MRLFYGLSKAAIILGTLMLSGILAGCGSKKEESYRSIQVYDIEGKGWVVREDIGEMELYANMQLQNNDRVRTDCESYVQLKLDEDKYVLLEPETVIGIVAEGDSRDSRTKIVLEEGAVVNRIENKLSENSSYEVETPSSTMAVRGTTFRVTVVKNVEGKLVSEVEVQEGKVECKIVVKKEDGTTKEQIVTLEAGKKTIIEGTPEGAESVEEVTSYTYHAYENEVLNFIGYSENENQKPDQPSQEKPLESEQDDKENQDKKENKDEINQEQKKEKKQNKKKNNENHADEAESELREENTETPNEETEDKNPPQDLNTENNIGSEITNTENNTGNESANTENNTGNESANTGNNTGNESVDTGNNTGNESADTGNNTGNESADTGSNTGGSNSPEDSGNDEIVQKYTVTFKYGENVENQTVASGDTVTKPAADPTTDGYWSEDGKTAFDFGTSITGSITLTWIDTTIYYTASFYYSDGKTVFATQKVISGTTINKPILMPTSFGYWSKEDGSAFDLETQITDNIILKWVSQ